MLWFWDALGTRTILWYGHGSSGYRMHAEHECYHVFGMDALVIAPTRNKNVIMVWACMLCNPTTLEHRKSRCVVYTVHIWGPRNTSNVGSCHEGHITRGRPNMHFLRVYAPTEPTTAATTTSTTTTTTKPSTCYYTPRSAQHGHAHMLGTSLPQSGKLAVSP